MESKKYMQRCLQLARNGMGNVAPNPLVGAVIVHENRIIGEGYHQKLGGPHAEVHAIQSVDDKSLLPQSTLFVSLEPCSHFGKTPPCVHLIIKNKIKRVVIAMRDPNPKVADHGVTLLREAGIEVTENVLPEEAAFLNRRFITFHTQKRPYIILKWAQSADGFMDRKRDNGDKPGINWISHPETKKLVHLWRSEESAILVGRHTVENDNPSLTTRLIDGTSPLRVVLAPSGDINPEAAILKDGNPTLIFNSKWDKTDGAATWIKTRNNSIDSMLGELYRRERSSVLVEGGRQTLETFLERGLWDEIRLIRSPIFLGEGLPAPKISIAPTSVKPYSKDQIASYFKR